MMRAVRSYNNTLNELKIAQHRLNALKQRRQELFNRLCVPKGWHVGEHGSGSDQSATERYVLMVNTPNDATGLSLNDEIEQCEQDVAELERLLEALKKPLGELSGIEEMLYCRIAIDGLAPTKAVEQVAEENYISIDWVWHRYYKRIKPYIENII